MTDESRKGYIFAMLARNIIFDDDLYYDSIEIMEMNVSSFSEEPIVILILIIYKSIYLPKITYRLIINLRNKQDTDFILICKLNNNMVRDFAFMPFLL